MNGTIAFGIFLNMILVFVIVRIIQTKGNALRTPTLIERAVPRYEMKGGINKMFDTFNTCSFTVCLLYLIFIIMSITLVIKIIKRRQADKKSKKEFD